MANGNVLITGGAGFIGSHLTDHLIDLGFNVTVLDNLSPQVHKDEEKDETGWPAYLNKSCRRIKGDVCDSDIVRESLKGQDYLVHLAATTGVGQSMVDILNFTKNNDLGAATVLQVLSEGKHKIKRMAVASSKSIYGDGAYLKPSTGEIVYPSLRSQKKLEKKHWEMEDQDGEILTPVPTPETKPLFPVSIYAVNKIFHEYSFLSVGQALGISTAAMRMFNVYGTRQSLSNPYTGVAAIFISRLKNNKPPTVFEDGQQRVNFIHVSDVARAYGAFLTSKKDLCEAYNVGSNEEMTITSLAKTIAELMKKNISPTITGQYRQGDTRHCFPDLAKIKKDLGWEPKVKLEQGLEELVEWSNDKRAIDYTQQNLKELQDKGLLK